MDGVDGGGGVDGVDGVDGVGGSIVISEEVVTVRVLNGPVDDPNNAATWKV